MQKTGQKRSILNKLREMTNVSGIAAEKFFNPEFKRVMESLRKSDNTIRSIISGTVISSKDESESVDEDVLKGDPTSLKDLLKAAKSAINRREYMSAAADLGRFHKKMYDVVQFISQLNLDVDKVHHEFLFKDLTPEQKEHLQSLKGRFASTQNEYFIKEASIMDFFMNIGTKRGRALAAWEKRYPKIVGKIKTETAAIYQKSEALLQITLSILKEMATARAVRNIDNYMEAAKKIVKSFSAYDSGKGGFKGYYNDTVKPFLEKIDLVEKKPEDISPTKKVEEVKDISKQEIPVEKKDAPAPKFEAELNMPAQKPEAPVVPALPNQTDPSPPPSGMESGPPLPTSGFGYPKVPTNLGPPVPAHDTSILPPPIEKPAYRQFLAALETMGNEDPIFVHAFIKKYAKAIQSTDPEISIQLFQIAKNII